MTYITDNILEAYQDNNNKWYINKYLTNTDNLGLFAAYAKDAILSDPGDKDYVGTVDEQNTYEINRFGFRGEIDGNSDILASGCSITFGIGLPESGRWTNFLSNSLDKTVMNLGSPGASVESICQNLVQYSLNTKMPKEIFCLFPDFFRRMVVVDKDFYKTKQGSQSTVDHTFLLQTFCNPTLVFHNGSVFMKIKDKKYIEDSISPHQLILNSVNAIYMLEAFCLTNNIKLHWTTWDIKTNALMKELLKINNFKLKNFVSLYGDNPKENLNLTIKENCDSDHNSEFKDSMCWNSGSDYSVIDYKKVYDRAHPGIHFQHHVADFFYKLHSQHALD